MPTTRTAAQQSREAARRNTAYKQASQITNPYISKNSLTTTANRPGASFASIPTSVYNAGSGSTPYRPSSSSSSNSTPKVASSGGSGGGSKAVSAPTTNTNTAAVAQQQASWDAYQAQLAAEAARYQAQLDNMYSTGRSNLSNYYDRGVEAYNNVTGILNNLEGQGSRTYQTNLSNLEKYLNVGQQTRDRNLANVDTLESRGTANFDTQARNLANYLATGQSIYNTNLENINNLERQGTQNYNNYFDVLADYLAQGQTAYNNNRQNIYDAFNTTDSALTENYNRSVENLDRVNEYNRQQAIQDAEAAARTAMINNAANNRLLQQQMTAQGLSSGMSETMRARMNNQALNAVAQINQNRDDNLANLENTYLNNMTNIENERNTNQTNMNLEMAKLLNAIEDRLTDVTGNYTTNYGSAQSAYTNFLSDIANSRNTANNNYQNFYGNYTSEQNALEQARLAFDQALTDSRNGINTNWQNFYGDYTNARNTVENNNLNFLNSLANARANNENSYTDFYGNYTNLSNELENAYLNGLGNYNTSYGARAQADDYWNWTNNTMSNLINAANAGVNMSNLVFNPVDTSRINTNYAVNPFAYTAASLAGINNGSGFALSDSDRAALALAQQAVNTSGITQNVFRDPTDWSNYVMQLSEANNPINTVSTQQANYNNLSANYQRALAQAELMSQQGADAQAVQSVLQSAVGNSYDAAQLEAFIRSLNASAA